MSYSTTVGKYVNLQQLAAAGKTLSVAGVGSVAHDMYRNIRNNGGTFVGALIGVGVTETFGMTHDKKAYLLKEIDQPDKLVQVSLLIED